MSVSSAAILVISILVMGYVDTSAIYHIVRAQSVIKLYVIYNMLEVQNYIHCTTTILGLNHTYMTFNHPSILVMGYVDTSAIYHIVRAQSVIKLYVIYNMLEVQNYIHCTTTILGLNHTYMTFNHPWDAKKERQGNTTRPRQYFSKKKAASGGTRTHDYPLARQHSYQLSYRGSSAGWAQITYTIQSNQSTSTKPDELYMNSRFGYTALVFL